MLPYGAVDHGDYAIHFTCRCETGFGQPVVAKAYRAWRRPSSAQRWRWWLDHRRILVNKRAMVAEIDRRKGLENLVLVCLRLYVVVTAKKQSKSRLPLIKKTCVRATSLAQRSNLRSVLFAVSGTVPG